MHSMVYTSLCVYDHLFFFHVVSVTQQWRQLAHEGLLQVVLCKSRSWYISPKNQIGFEKMMKVLMNHLISGLILGTFNHYLITKWPKFWPPFPPPLFSLVRFRKLPSLECSELYIKHHLQPSQRTVNFVIL